MLTPVTGRVDCFGCVRALRTQSYLCFTVICVLQYVYLCSYIILCVIYWYLLCSRKVNVIQRQ